LLIAQTKVINDTFLKLFAVKAQPYFKKPWPKKTLVRYQIGQIGGSQGSNGNKTGHYVKRINPYYSSFPSGER
jgi:hypothetical protein